MNFKQLTLNNTWVKEESLRKILKCFALNENKTFQNVWDTAKSVLWEIFSTECKYYKRKDLKPII